MPIEVIKTQYITRYSKHFEYLGTAFKMFERISRDSFNLFIDDDGRMQKFIENSDKLETHIDGVLNMLCGRGMWLRKTIIYEDLNETCSQNYIEKVMSTVKHAMDLYDIRSAMVGEDVR